MISNKQKKLLELKTNNLVESLFVGNYATNKKSTGIQFADYQEYEYGDDSKNIDWIASEKEGKLIKRLYSEERELDVYIGVLGEKNIHFSIYGTEKKDIFEEILYFLSFSTISSQNKLSVFWNNGNNKNIFPLKKSKEHFVTINNNFSQENFTDKYSGISLEKFNGIPQSKGILFILSTSLDVDMKQLKIAKLKHDVIFCHIFHSFENNLEGSGLVTLGNNEEKLHIDLDDEDKKNQYISHRRKILKSFRKTVIQSGIDYLYFDEKSDIFSEFYKFFKSR